MHPLRQECKLHRLEQSAHVVSTSPPAATVEAPALACPDCGAHVRLVLVPDTEAPVREGTAQRKNLHAAPNPLPDFESSVRQHKRELIARALEENDGVMTRAAKAVGLKYTTFVAMVHRLDATDEEPDTRAD